MKTILLVISLLSSALTFITSADTSETLNLDNEVEIKKAAEIYNAVDRITEKVMACVNSNNDKTEGCICLHENSCKFKEEFRYALKLYCETKNIYPEWEGRILYYTLPGDPNGYSLSMTGLEKQFGSDCK